MQAAAEILAVAHRLEAPPAPLSAKPMLVTPREEIAARSVLLKSGTALPPRLGLDRRPMGDWELVRALIWKRSELCSKVSKSLT